MKISFYGKITFAIICFFICGHIFAQSKYPQLKYNAFMVTGSVLPTVLLLGAFAVNPLLGLAVLTGAATTIVTFLRADVLVRRAVAAVNGNS